MTELRREATEQEQEQDIVFLTKLLMEIKDYAISIGEKPDVLIKEVAEWMIAILEIATFNNQESKE